ncbi:MAG TPA: DNA primase [Fimbriimonas sp.]
MTDERDLIRERIDIVDLVGQSVHLKRSGKNWKGLCPFHSDKNPSFYVTPDTGRYKCGSCQEAGDVFTWVMKTQNVDFPEALRILAKQANVELKPRTGQPSAQERKTQESAMEAALAFFVDQLKSNPKPREYCARRDIDDQTLLAWEIGWAPEVGEALAVHLRRNGFSLLECKGLFLVDGDPSFGYHDKFRSRLIFPIRDERGRLVAFGGRIIGDGHPKYINSSDTPLYRKSRVLYGLHRAKDTIGSSRQAVLVEGYLDVIACHRAGVTNAVASLGTSLSEDHAKLLKRWCEEVVILYDSDDAGRKAAERAVSILQAEGLRVRVALMPAGEDPDTLLRNAGPAAVRQAVESGITPLDYQIQTLMQNQLPSQDQFWEDAVASLAAGANDLEVDKWVVRLSTMYPGLRDPLQAQRLLRRWIARVRRGLQRQPGKERPAVVLEHRPLPERLTSVEFTVFMAFCSEEFRSAGWMVARQRDLFVTDLAAQFSDAIAAAFPSAPPDGPIGSWLHQIEPETLRQSLSDLAFDFRALNLTEQKVTDTIERLERLQKERHLRSLKQQELSNESLRLIDQKLRDLKPKYDKPAQSEDDGLF